MSRSDDEAPATNQDDKLSTVDEYLFTSSWLEDERDEEHDIIKVAHYQFLPQTYRQHVLHHLPDIKDCSQHGHGHCSLRQLPNGGFEITMSKERSMSETTEPHECLKPQYWIMSKRLQSLASVVHTFERFRKVYIDLIRCHRLLWVYGIAHGDICFSNLKYHEGNEGPEGILIDFDLMDSKHQKTPQ